MKEFTTNDIVKNASDEQLEQLFKLSYAIGDILEDIASEHTDIDTFIKRMAFCPDYCKIQMLNTAAMAEMSNREKNK